MNIEFSVPGVPIAQPRVKARRAGNFLRVYTPKTADAYKASIGIAFMNAMTSNSNDVWSPPNDPVCIHIKFMMPRPKSMLWKSKPMLAVAHTKRPDIDNLSKAVLDSLYEIAWQDDSQVYEIVAKKFITEGNDHPRTLIRICYG